MSKLSSNAIPLYRIIKLCIMLLLVLITAESFILAECPANGSHGIFFFDQFLQTDAAYSCRIKIIYKDLIDGSRCNDLIHIPVERTLFCCEQSIVFGR